MRAIGLIPARLQSTRLPQKLLLADTGKPIIQYTWERASSARSLSEVIVATDSTEIADAVRKFGGRVELTGDHPSGTDRIAEVTRRCCGDAGVLVNIQGDEPEIDPEQIDLLVDALSGDQSAEMATLATPITSPAMLNDPARTKVVVAADGRALYFSRSPIPHCRDGNIQEVMQHDNPWLLHLGIYAYRRDYLLRLTKLSPSRLERLEKLEQLRALEDGATIRVALVEHPAVGIDTPEDYSRFVERVRQRAA